MGKTLHITNGDSAVNGMREAGITDDTLPWRDVLHIGPVQNHETWQSFDRARIEFLISVNLGERQYVKHSFAERQAVMSQLKQYQKIYLWFEHDLYDQLQLLQLLIELTPELQLHDRIDLIITDLYLGHASPSDFQELFRFSEPLTAKHLLAAAPYWHALTHHSPELYGHLDESTVLPFMYPAFKRLCEEYPNTENGLSRVQNCILSLLGNGIKGSELFSLYQATEEACFLGDSVFALILNDLIYCKTPLLKFKSPTNGSHVWKNILIRTDAGDSVYEKQHHHVTINGVNRWIGGVHLTDDNVWCYDKKNEKFNFTGLNDKR